MQITIDGQTFTVTEDGEKLTIIDSKNNVIGITNDMQSATAICEQIAWRRRVDGKLDEPQKAVDEKPIAVDETLTKDAGVDETGEISNVVIHRIPENERCLLPKSFINDERLSFEAIGLFITIFQFPDDTVFTEDMIKSLTCDPDVVIEKALSELETYGYAVKKSDNTYDFYEVPHCVNRESKKNGD